MPTYEIRGLDGNLYQIDGPPGVTKAQIKAKILERAPQAGIPLQDKNALERSGAIGNAAAWLADIPLRVGEGLTGVGKSFTDTFGASNAASDVLDSASQYMHDLRSSESRRQDQINAARSATAKTKGKWAEVKAAGQNFLSSPLESTASLVGSAIPFIGAGLVTEGAAVPLMLGAVSGAGTIKGDIYDAMYRVTREHGATEEQAVAAADKAQEYAGQNIDQIALGTVLGAVASATGLPRQISSIIGRKAAAEVAEQAALRAATPAVEREAAKHSLLKGTVAGAAEEAVPEAIQEGQEQFAENLAQRRAGYDTDLWGGVAGRAAAAGIASLIPGGYGGYKEARHEGRTIPSSDAREAGDQSLNAAIETVLANPEDQAAFDEIVGRYASLYGISHEQAAQYAKATLAQMRGATDSANTDTPTGEGGEVDAQAEATKRAPYEPDPVVPPVDAVSPQAQFNAQTGAAPTQGATPAPGGYTVQSAVDEYMARVASNDMNVSPELLQFFANHSAEIEAEFARRKSAAEAAAPTQPAAPDNSSAPVATDAAPAPTLELPADVKKKVTPERLQTATAMLNEALASPDFEGLEVTPKELKQAANRLVRDPTKGAAATLSEVLGLDTAIADENNYEAAQQDEPAQMPDMAPTPEVEQAPAPAPALTGMALLNEANQRFPGNDMLATAFYNGASGKSADAYFQSNASPDEQFAFEQGQQFAGQTVADTATAQTVAPEASVTAVTEDAASEPSPGPEPVPEVVEGVPVTKVAPGVARGVKPVQRGTQGTKRGRPVEGAAELTEGMQAQQKLVGELRVAREAGDLSDNDVSQVLETLRPPTDPKTGVVTVDAISSLPLTQRFQWLTAIRMEGELSALRKRLSDTSKEVLGKPNPDHVELEQAVGKLQQRLDKAQIEMVEQARAEAKKRVGARKLKRAKTEADYKQGKITKRERDMRLRELRVDKHLMPVMALKDTASSLLHGDGSVAEDPALPEALRGPENVIAAVQQAADEGQLSQEAADFLRWVVEQNPDAATHVAMHVFEPTEGSAAAGHYDPLTALAAVVAGSGKNVPVHEFMHHMERLMPPEVQRAIESNWYDELERLRKAATPFSMEAAYFNAIHDAFYKEGISAEDKTRLLQAAFSLVNQGAVGSQYAMFTPSEFWAEHATDILAGRYGARGSIIARARQWLREFSQHVRKWLGLPNHSAVIKALNGLSKVDGSAKSSSLIVGTEGLAFAPKTKQDAQINKAVRKAQLANTAAGFFEGLDEASQAAREVPASEKFENAKQGARSSARPVKLALQPTSIIQDNIARMRPGLGSVLREMSKLDQKMRAMRSNMRKAFERRAKELKRFVDRHGQATMALMMHTARKLRVDVTSHASLAELLKNDPVMVYATTNKLQRTLRRREGDIRAAWKVWEELGKQDGGHAMYKQVRQFYRDMYTAMRAERDEDIRGLGIDGASVEELLKAAHGEETELASDDEEYPGVPESMFPQEYFPFRRFGDYALLVQGKKRGDRERYHFENANERNQFMSVRARMIAKERGIEVGSPEYNEMLGEVFDKHDGIRDLRENIQGDSIMLSKMFKIIDAAKMDTSFSSASDVSKAKENLKDKLYQTYLMTLPERSLRKQFLHAELITGQSADIQRVFTTSAAQYASQLPKMVYGRDLQRQIESAYDAIREGDPDERAKLRTMVTRVVSRYREMMDPPPQSKWEQRANTFVFFSMMSSVASAMAQPFVLPAQVLPRAVSRYGVGAIRMMGSYTRAMASLDIVVDKDPATGERWIVPPSLGNTPSIRSNPLRNRLWRELNDVRDLFSQKHANMLLRNRPTRNHGSDTLAHRAGNAYEGIVSATGMLFSAADQTAREIAGMTYAELEYKKLRNNGKSHEEAIEGAVEAAIRNTDETVGNYTELEKPDIMRGGPIRRMFGFLRTYSVQRTAYYFRMLDALYKGSPTQTRIEAFKELSMVLAFGSLAVGVGGNFGYSATCALINLLIPLMLSDDDMDKWRRRSPLGADDADYRFRYEWIPAQFGAGSSITKALQRGGLSVATGWDFSSRLSQNDLWVRSLKKGDTPGETVTNFLAANLAPHVSQATNMLDGISDMSEGRWSKGVAKIVPAAVRGLVNAQRLETEGEKTKAGRPVMKPEEFTTADLVGQALGFTPEKLASRREGNRALQGLQIDMAKERGRLFDDYRDIFNDPDATPEEIDAVVDRMERYNAKVPGNLNKYRIDAEDVIRSIRSYNQRSARTVNGVEFAPGEEAALLPNGEM